MVYFLFKIYYKEIENLIKTIKDWGTSEVQFISTADMVDISILLRIPCLLVEIGIIYGKK